MTEDELTTMIRDCQTKRARLIKADQRESIEYAENNRLEDGLLNELFELRFKKGVHGNDGRDSPFV